MQIYRVTLQETREGWIEPAKEDYLRAFLTLPEWASKLLKIQVSAPGHGVTMRQMSALAEFRHGNAANVRYGKACRLVSEAIGTSPAYYWSEKAANWWSVVSDECSEMQELVWVMRPNAVAACKHLGWENSEVGIYRDPTEGGAEKAYVEGRMILIPVTIYERDQAARRECIRNFGSWKCQICGMDFLSRYGEIGKEFIHVHHLVPVSSREGEYKLNPHTDLLPACPNCHAMLHKREPPYTPDELRDFLQRNS